MARIFLAVHPTGQEAPHVSEFIPFNRPDITQAEIDEVVATLRSGWLTTGPRSRKLEEQFARRIGAAHAVAVSSCTAGLHVALIAAGVGPGDEVVTTPYTFTASAAAVLHAGATPVLADVEADTANIDPAAIERAITPRTKAIIPVHIAGHPAEMDPITELAARHKLTVIEDAAHSLPAAYKGRTIGTISPMTVFSFYATKNLSTGEGGMTTTNDAALRERLAIFGYHGMSRDGWKRYTAKGSWYYEILEDGFKYNMPDLFAALGLVQLARLDEMQQKREAIVAAYQEAFADLPGVFRPQARPHVTHAWHLYMIRIDSRALRIDRDQFIQELSQRDIGVSVHFIPLARHPLYQRRLGVTPEQFPVAESVFQSVLSLPLFPSMTSDQVTRVIETVRAVAREHRR
jgi:dTDP-4-amino-4,6-dideoxygalactose transaminase